MNWLIIGLVLVVLFILLKLSHIKHKSLLIIGAIIILFIYFTFTVVSANNVLDFKTPSGLMNSMKIYFLWLNQGFANVKVITGNLIKMDWAPDRRNVSDLDPRNIMKG